MYVFRECLAFGLKFILKDGVVNMMNGCALVGYDTGPKKFILVQMDLMKKTDGTKLDNTVCHYTQDVLLFLYDVNWVFHLNHMWLIAACTDKDEEARETHTGFVHDSATLFHACSCDAPDEIHPERVWNSVNLWYLACCWELIHHKYLFFFVYVLS